LDRKLPNFPKVKLEESDFASATLHMKADAYRPSGLDLSKLSIVPHDLVTMKHTYSSTTWQGFVESQCLLLKALCITPQQQWGKMWCASAIPEYSVIRLNEFDVPHVIYHASRFLMRTIQLRPYGLGTDEYLLNTGCFADLPLTSLNEAMCARVFQIGLEAGKTDGFFIRTLDWEPVKVFICRVQIWRSSKDQIADLSEMFDMERISIKLKSLEMVTLFVNQAKIEEPLRSTIIKRATDRLANRQKNKTGDENANDDNLAAEDELDLASGLDPEVRAAVKKDSEVIIGAAKASRRARSYESDSEANSDETDGGHDWPEEDPVYAPTPPLTPSHGIPTPPATPVASPKKPPDIPEDFWSDKPSCDSVSNHSRVFFRASFIRI
jgi:hypothetical protein